MILIHVMIKFFFEKIDIFRLSIQPQITMNLQKSKHHSDLLSRDPGKMANNYFFSECFFLEI